jgi:alpha-amylase
MIRARWRGVLCCAATCCLPTNLPAQDWIRGGTCYEVFVRSFFDSDADGIGDLRGLTQRLDYINDGDSGTTHDLGANCIWLMPVAAAASYHGYDVKDYYRVAPEYGSNADFRALVAEAHKRGIRVLVDMVLNHVSSEHPYFKDALRNPASPYRDWFRFSPSKPDQPGPPPWDASHGVWHKSPLRDEYYFGVFWAGMPDLNYESPAVREEAKKIARFWLGEMGVDGFRLDAIPYLVEEGNALFSTPGTHAFLREYAAAIQRIKPGAFTVGEVWDSAGALHAYYPDQLDSYFVLDVGNAIIDGVRTGSPRGILEPYLRMQSMAPAPRWAPFLRNHDQRRVMRELGGDVAQAKVAATLLLTLPGLPFVYYGEEIGMIGDKPDPRLRSPMQWTAGPHAGFSTAAVWEPLQRDSTTANVELQSRDSSSLLNHYRRLIHLRATDAALQGGKLIPLRCSTDSAIAYARREGNRTLITVANLSRSRAAISVSAPAGTSSAGSQTARALLPRSDPGVVSVLVDGSFQGWVPIQSFGPMEARLFVIETGNPRRR